MGKRKRTLKWLTILMCIAVGLHCGNDDADNDDDSTLPDEDDADDDSNDDDELLDDDQGDDDTGPVLDIEGTSTNDTWTDPTTGLAWQTFQQHQDEGTSENNSQYCRDLVLGDYNDWRLPSLSEYRSLIRGCDHTQTGGDCPASDDCTDGHDCRNNSCLGCPLLGGPAQGCYWPPELSGYCGGYMSSTLWGADSGWFVSFGEAQISTGGTGDPSWAVRCVRGEWTEK